LWVITTNLPIDNFNAIPSERLHNVYPEPMNINTLRKSVGYQHSTNFRQMIRTQAKAGITYIKGDDVYLTQKGAAWVDRNIDMQLKL